jgi:predicted metalloprotease with PDZ domain
LGCSGISHPREEQVVKYRLTPEFNRAALRQIGVELIFTGDADGSTKLMLPDRGGGDDWPRPANFNVAGAQPTGVSGSRELVLKHEPRALIRVRYSIVPDGAGEPGADHPLYKPIIRPNWFHLIGEATFAFPSDGSRLPAQVSWGALPAGWKSVSDLDPETQRGGLKVAEVIASVTLGGNDLEVAQFRLQGGTLRIASRGAFDFRHAEFQQEALGIVQAVNAFWGENGRPYLITLIPFTRSGNGVRSEGAGRDDAFAFGATTDLRLEDRRHTLAHEYLHSWIPYELGDWRPQAADEPLDKWFGEGFADFYASRMLLRSRIWSLEEFAREWNGVLTAYAGSPAIRTGNAELARRYYEDGAHQEMAYRRGALFAALLDRELRARGHVTLDDLMRVQHVRALPQLHSESRTPAAPLLLTLLEERAPWAMPLLRRHIEGGVPIMLPPETFGKCLTIATETTKSGLAQRVRVRPSLTLLQRRACAAE